MEKQHNTYLFTDKLIGFLIGASGGALCSVILSLMFAFIFTLTSFSDSFIVIISYVVFAISAFVSGLISVLKLKKAGLVNGFISGICYFVLYAVFSFVFGSNSIFAISTLLMLFISIIFNTLGGILAVNIR